MSDLTGNSVFAGKQKEAERCGVNGGDRVDHSSVRTRSEEAKLAIDRAKTVSIVEMINRMFPHLIVEPNGRGDRFKVRLEGEGILAITGSLFNLDWTKHAKGRFSGSGAPNLYCDLKNYDRQTDFMRAVKEINDAFFGGYGFTETDREAIRIKLEQQKREAVERKQRQELPAQLLAVSSSPRDQELAKEYLINSRGLSPQFVDNAFLAGAIYATREHPNRNNYKINKLGIVFPHLDHRTDVREAFAWRDPNDTGKYSKINRGPKTFSAFRLGTLDHADQNGSIAVTESAIEAASYWEIMARKNPAKLARTAVMGMSGRGDPSYMLDAVKDRGVSEVIAAYNNDPAGMEMNHDLIEAAMARGLTARQLVFYGEVDFNWQDIPDHAEYEMAIRTCIEQYQLPVREGASAQKGWKTLRLPNLQGTRELSTKLLQLRAKTVNYTFRDKTSRDRLAPALEDHLKSADAQYSVHPGHSEETWSIMAPPKTPNIMKGFEDAAGNDILSMTRTRGLIKDSEYLAGADWVRKDWNDLLRNKGTLYFRDHPKVLEEWGPRASKTAEKSLTDIPSLVPDR